MENNFHKKFQFYMNLRGLLLALTLLFGMCIKFSAWQTNDHIEPPFVMAILLAFKSS